jgi:C4-dicarboxylate transporter DctM subunit
MLTLSILVLAILFAIGVPIYMAFALGGLSILLFVIGVPLSQLASMFFENMNSFVLLAGPLFILAGNIMFHGGLGKPLTEFLYSITARLPGGVAIATVIACTFTGALTGSTIATMAAVGLIMYPAMVGAKYDKGFSGGILCASSNLGNLIPPSLAFIMFGYLTDTSVAGLFMAGVFPGLLLALLLSIVVVIIAKKRKFPLMEGVNWRDRKKQFFRALPALFMPVIILGGIYGGVFTPTEAAAVACIYGILVSVFIFKKLNWHTFWICLTETTKVVGIILMLIAGAIFLGKAFTLLGFPQAISKWVINAGLGPQGFLILFVVVYALLGCVMEGLAIMFVTLPLIFPAASTLQIDPMHLGVVFCVSVLMAGMTPPVSIFVYATAGMFKIDIQEVTKGILPFLAITFLTLVILTFFPGFSTFLPKLMMGIR